MQVTYHSLHGSIQESIHVFIEAGLKQFSSLRNRPLHILEMGFGTGLNCLLTLMESNKSGQHINYSSIEKFPLAENEFTGLNYCEFLNSPHLQSTFIRLHTCEWDQPVNISNQFSLHKRKADLQSTELPTGLDLIYYDAFAPTAQPELWSEPIFSKLFQACLPGAILVTYCSRSSVQRAMKAAGWQIEKIPGPWGKREMIRAHRKD